MRFQCLPIATTMVALALALPSFAEKTADLAKVKNGHDCRKCDLTALTHAQGKNIVGVDVSGSNLAGSDLSGEDLRSVDFHSANLSHANLSGSNLTGVDLSYAIMNGAILCNTTMPDGRVIYSGC